MSEEEKPDQPIIPDVLPEQVEKELNMYRDYLQHTPIDDMVIKYDMSPESIYKIARRNEWKKKRIKIKEKAYKQLDNLYKEQLVDIASFVQKDLLLLIKKCTRNQREMTKDERFYVLNLFEKLVKESRLSEGKPTEITGGNQVVRHEVILPPGVEHYGVIPPANNVIQISKLEDKEAEIVTKDTHEEESEVL